MIGCGEYIPYSIGECEFSHLWASGRCHSQYNLADHEWRINILVSHLCFGSLYSASRTPLTIWCANPQPLGTCVPWKDPQSIIAISSMDLLYTPTDAVVPLLDQLDLPDMNDRVLPSSLDPYLWMATTHNIFIREMPGCVSSNSSINMERWTVGTMTLVPHRIHPSSQDISCLRLQNSINVCHKTFLQVL